MTTTTVNVKNWYTGKTIDEMLVIMSRLSHECVAYFMQGNKQKSEDLWDEFDARMKEVIPAIVEEKTFYWAYNKDAWQNWEDFHRNLFSFKNTMENGIYNLVTKGTL